MPEQPDVGGDRKWLTYDEATPEQVTAVRENFRRKFAESKKRSTPEYFAALREQLGFPPRTP